MNYYEPDFMKFVIQRIALGELQYLHAIHQATKQAPVIKTSDNLQNITIPELEIARFRHYLDINYPNAPEE